MKWRTLFTGSRSPAQGLQLMRSYLAAFRSRPSGESAPLHAERACLARIERFLQRTDTSVHRATARLYVEHYVTTFEVNPKFIGRQVTTDFYVALQPLANAVGIEYLGHILLEHASTGQYDVRATIVETMRLAPSTAVADFLIQELSAPKSDIAAECALALGYSANARAANVLVTRLSDSDARLRYEVVRAITRLPPDPALVEAIERRLRPEYPYVTGSLPKDEEGSWYFRYERHDEQEHLGAAWYRHALSVAPLSEKREFLLGNAPWYQKLPAARDVSRNGTDATAAASYGVAKALIDCLRQDHSSGWHLGSRPRTVAELGAVRCCAFLDSADESQAELARAARDAVLGHYESSVHAISRLAREYDLPTLVEPLGVVARDSAQQLQRRREAVRTIVTLGSPSAVELLCDLADTDAEFRGPCINAITPVGVAADRLIGSLRFLLSNGQIASVTRFLALLLGSRGYLHDAVNARERCAFLTACVGLPEIARDSNGRQVLATISADIMPDWVARNYGGYRLLDAAARAIHHR